MTTTPQDDSTEFVYEHISFKDGSEDTGEEGDFFICRMMNRVSVNVYRRFGGNSVCGAANLTPQDARKAAAALLDAADAADVYNIPECRGETDDVPL